MVVQSLIDKQSLYYISTMQVLNMKSKQSLLLILLGMISLTGCNTLNMLEVSGKGASACQQGINNVNQQLNTKSLSIHKTNLSRANSLLVSAQVQLQFAEYPGCLEKVKRAQEYLSGRQTAVISRLSM